MLPMARTRLGRVLLPLLLLLACGARAQQYTIFVGQGQPPPQPVQVDVTVILDKLMVVDDKNYRFEAMLVMIMTWNDTRARAAIANSTAESQSGNYTCLLPCSSMYRFINGSNCCDGMWLPQLEFVNARGFSQDRNIRYGIKLPAANTTNADAVAWVATVQGEFFTPLQFKSFPFDKQLLLIQVAYAERTALDDTVTFQQSSTGLELYTPRTGDDLSGWHVQSLDVYFKRMEDRGIKATTVSRVDDPWPTNPAFPGKPQYLAPLWHQGFDIVITVKRISSYFIITTFVPIALNVWLALLVFAVNPKNLDTRLGIVVTLFLSLTALIFVVTAGLPESSTVMPVQQAVLLSYFMLGVIGIESIWVCRLVTMQRHKLIRRKTAAARKQFVRRLERAKSGISKSGAASAVAAAEQAEAAQRRLERGGAPAGAELESAAAQPGEGQHADGGTAYGTAAPQNSRSVHMGGIGIYSTMSNGSESSSSSGGSGSGSGSGPLYESSSPGEEGDGASGGWCGARQRRKGSRESKAERPPGWLRRQWISWRAMQREVRKNHHFALWVALRIDYWSLWIFGVGYTVGLVVLVALQCGLQPTYGY